ncbi:hypothetical protein Plav_2289 [Parvibaculum lavamentivorans DS-1]|uniref:Uncharacterized protein n=1 Tax=Parvibaculum lavamentivorans (strain DS-1 / DSM 13023 / NCIMB 13966) TaxID=402881 RepID=A7HVH0_PARL1|nr:hypothetical protein [Parvibaculum lavamentivorans]ABS63903.1 hypothetical protein Plav_2289 [Parvibaculum lavamentivorans DS-1]
MAGPIKDTDQARQGTTGTGTRYVFAISFAAVVILLFAVAWAFFGPPNLGMEDAQTGMTRENPAITPPVETPDWQEPAPVQNPSQ